ncbi:MAG: insulinase family protein [Deltaproteobacteria bacterium]|nr:insulinase family protein [Deltaproteobacteria bacterium]
MTRRVRSVLLLSAACSALSACPSPSTPTRAASPPPVPPEAAPWALAVSVYPLDGGARALLLPRQPERFAAAVLFPVDAATDEPPSLEGLTRFMLEAALLETEGDDDRAAGPARRALLLGGAIHAYDDGAVAGWWVEGPERAGPGLLRLLRDVALSPRFPATRIQARAEMAREELAQTHTDLALRGLGWAVGLALGAGRPLADGPLDGTLARLHREDLARAHARLVTPARAVVAVEGVAPDLVAQIFRGWTAPPAPPPLAAGCAPAVAYQAWVAGPDGDARVVIGVPAPGPGDADRAALEELLAEADTHGVVGGPRVTLADRGARSVLVLESDGLAPDALEPVERWLADLGRALPGEAAAAPLGPRLRRAELRVRSEHALARLTSAGRAALGLLDGEATAAPGASALAITTLPADAAARARVLRALRDPDRRVRVAVGPDEARRRLELWGPVVNATRATSLCARPSGDGGDAGTR